MSKLSKPKLSKPKTQTIIEIADPAWKVESREDFRKCPLCLNHDSTMYDPCMLSHHLHGPTHSKFELVEFLLDEIQGEDVLDNLQ